MLCRTCVFASGWICGPRRVVRCVRRRKHPRTVFHAQVGPVWLHKKHCQIRYLELVFLYLVGSTGHTVHSDASKVHNVEALFCMLRSDLYGMHQKRIGNPYVELVFLHPLGFAGHIVHFGASQVWNIDALFFMLGLYWYDFHKKRNGTHYAKLGFFHPVGSVGHVVQSGTFGPWNDDALFFLVRWARCSFH
jgi:hypothetical protein